MSAIKLISDDVVELSMVDVTFRRTGGAALALIGVLGIYGIQCGPTMEHRWVLALFPTAMLLGGVCLFSYVKRIRIDRRFGIVTKRWGWLVPSKEKTTTVEPTGIRLTLNRAGTGCKQLNINRLYLMHREGLLELVSCGGSLEKLRKISEFLGQFLAVERIEDRLHRLLGAFVNQCGRGVEPTRTYVDRGETVPLPTGVETCDFSIQMSRAGKDSW